ncbi:MAG: hypothetical protein HRU72_14540 [Planctomycetia bacterium]|nr:MAG: hypothetical protein HRU72_14540 [Planctomycetia bacterium]
MMINDLILKRFTVGSFPVNGYLVADPVTRIWNISHGQTTFVRATL